jgi:capsular exopolysaccharide synthesis family protein
VHTNFGVPNATGFADLLQQGQTGTGELPADGSVPGAHPSGVDNLWLLTAGRQPSNPSELIGASATAGVVTELGRRFDLVVIDTPPVGPVTDAQLLGAYSDGVLVVVRSGQTHRTGLRGALEAIKHAGRPILGIVLNDLRPGALSRYTSYGYYYSGYYGKHGDEDAQPPAGGSKVPVGSGVHHHAPASTPALEATISLAQRESA